MNTFSFVEFFLRGTNTSIVGIQSTESVSHHQSKLVSNRTCMYYSNVNCSCVSGCSSHAGYPRPAPPPPGDCSTRGVERLPCSQGSSQCDCSLTYSPAAEISADAELYWSREGHLCAVPHPNGPHVRLEHRTGTPPPPPPVVCASVYTLSPSPPPCREEECYRHPLSDPCVGRGGQPRTKQRYSCVTRSFVVCEHMVAAERSQRVCYI